MCVSRGTLIAAGQAESAPRAAIVLIEGKLQPHAIRIVFAAAKTVVPSYLHVSGIVAGLGHGVSWGLHRW